ncbi:Peroxisomal membrane protein PMP22 [Carex littledalei]|uniref:Peroxisomal membrane protein PMP22 n=1 Tax=Carex littledalei TaxID=544730 RepID=A0A833RHW6_9POAL|nr:Peroxisomal membrane protein PMP22 [Carex littledalei]
MSEIASKAWAGYVRSLNSHPLPTKAVTAGVLTGLSDAIAQKLSGNKHIQIKRLLSMFLTGLLYMGPFDHFLHKLLDKLFHGNKKETIAKKVFVQEFIISPINTALFLTFYGKVVEGKSLSAVKDKVKRDLPSIQFASWRFWPFVAWFNYQFVPMQLRVLFMNTIGVGW